MRIPSGDLAPARRRTYRRRRGRAAPLALLLLVAVAAGAYLLHRDDAEAPARLAGGCPTTAPRAAARPVAVDAALPAPGQVRLRVYNGTDRDGLGRTVGGGLAARGFAVLSTTNAPTPLAGPSRVRYGPGARPAATLLAAQVSGARLQPLPRAPRGSLDLVLGAGFVRLRTPAEAQVALAAPPPVVQERPVVRASAAARPSPAC